MKDEALILAKEFLKVYRFKYRDLSKSRIPMRPEISLLGIYHPNTKALIQSIYVHPCLLIYLTNC